MTKIELETCIETYGRDIYSFCRQLTKSTLEADELYQDTFLKAVELNASIRSDHNPKSFLLSVAIRIWKNKRRKFAWRNRIAAMDALPEGEAKTACHPEKSNPDQLILKQEEAAQIRHAVNRLPNRLKIPVLLFYMEDLSTAQIAGILNIPDGTVKSRLHRARTILKKDLEVIFDEIYG